MDFEVEVSNLILFLQKYTHHSVDNLLGMLRISTKAKSKNYILSNALCSQYKGKEIFEAICEHENIHLKTIQLKENGKPQEAMSFAPIDFKEIVKETWETSTFKKYIDGRFLFFVFKKTASGNFLENIFLWKISNDDLENVKDIWEKTKKLLQEGRVIRCIDEKGKVITNFPNEASTLICHVRPHGRDGVDLNPLPIQDVTTGYNVMSKQSFWFNHNFLYKIVKERE